MKRAACLDPELIQNSCDRLRDGRHHFAQVVLELTPCANRDQDDQGDHKRPFDSLTAVIVRAEFPAPFSRDSREYRIRLIITASHVRESGD
ncbi:hypothetical protein THIOKS12210009 [Thiocapsa sp. KS1]|nr:hypothetical protein THIOKS12210009 [Thiocapsa sp. KS1]